MATTDVLYDLTFLLMDLWHRGLCTEANLVFNRYLDKCNEEDGLPDILPDGCSCGCPRSCDGHAGQRRGRRGSSAPIGSAFLFRSCAEGARIPSFSDHRCRRFFRLRQVDSRRSSRPTRRSTSRRPYLGD
jgi:hypothetical protein